MSGRGQAALAVGVLIGGMLVLTGAKATSADSTCTINWTGAGDGASWADPNNWDTSVVPATGDVVCIAGAAGTVTFDGSGGTSNSQISELRSTAPLAITGGELSVTDTAATGNTVGGLSLSGGQVGDSATPEGSLQVDGDFSWSGGSFNASSSQVPAPVLTETAGHAATVSNPSANVNTWSLALNSPLAASGSIGLAAGGGIAESAATILADGTTISDQGGAGTFSTVVGGTLTKAATAGTATIGVPVSLGAVVSVPGGTLNLGEAGAGGSIGAPFSAVAGAVLGLNGVNINAGATSSGAGRAMLSGTINDATSLGIANVTESGGTTTATAPLAIAGTLSITGGEVNLPANNNSVGALAMSGGQLGDSANSQGSLKVNGNLSWTGGSFAASSLQSPSAVLTETSGHAATIANPAGSLNNWVLSLSSPLAASGAFGFQAGGGISMNATATLADGTSIANQGGAGPFTLTAAGTLTKAATSGTATLGVPVVNIGTVRAGGGTLSLTGLNNSGTLDLSSGSVVLNGNYAPAASSTLAVTVGGSAPGAGYGQLNVCGNTTLNGKLAITDGAAFSPTAGQNFFVVTQSCGATAGKFTTIAQSTTPNGLAYAVHVKTYVVSLTPVSPNFSDLFLSGSAPNAASLGSPVTDTGTVTNNGPSADDNVTLTFVLPAGMTFVSASTGCTLSASTVTCAVTGPLAAGASASFHVNLTASAKGGQKTTISTGGNLPDPTTRDNTLALTTKVS